MKKVTFNKLVRDRIPEIIKEDHKECDFSILDQRAFIASLYEKLKEEIGELFKSETEELWLEELADIQEVIHALLKVKGYSFSKLEEKRLAKREARGGFDKRCFLKSVKEVFNDENK